MAASLAVFNALIAAWNFYLYSQTHHTISLVCGLVSTFVTLFILLVAALDF